jgi:serine phosphatase RsbU (regulator of sigma subunit)
VGRRVGAAIANTKLYERERRIAVELQSASLPQRVPDFPGVRLDAAYLPGGREASVGGDWYDAFVLADRRLAITVGDVVGHGLTAAVSMTKLRLAMQSAARVDPDPNVMLRVADEVIVSRADRYATAIAAIYDPETQALTYASAGHPGPVTRTAQGAVEDSSAPGIMLGLRHGAASETRTIPTPPGTTMVFFTDGLIEVTRDMDEGYGRLFGALADPELPHAEHPAAALVTTVLGEDEPRDDIAVLVLSFE